MSGPYFLVEGHDVAGFPSLRDVEVFLEPYDVASNRLFRADGAELSLTTTGKGSGTPIYKRRVAAKEEIIGHDASLLADALRAQLVETPKRVRPRSGTTAMAARDLAAADLSQLVEEFLKVVGVRG